MLGAWIFNLFLGWKFIIFNLLSKRWIPKIRRILNFNPSTRLRQAAGNHWYCIRISWSDLHWLICLFPAGYCDTLWRVEGRHQLDVTRPSQLVLLWSPLQFVNFYIYVHYTVLKFQNRITRMMVALFGPHELSLIFSGGMCLELTSL